MKIIKLFYWLFTKSVFFHTNMLKEFVDWLAFLITVKNVTNKPTEDDVLSQYTFDNRSIEIFEILRKVQKKNSVLYRVFNYGYIIYNLAIIALIIIAFLMDLTKYSWLYMAIHFLNVITFRFFVEKYIYSTIKKYNILITELSNLNKDFFIIQPFKLI